MSKTFFLVLLSIICSFAASKFAKRGELPQLYCGSSGDDYVWLDENAPQYLATINNNFTGSPFTVHFTLTQFNANPSCDKTVLTAFVGNGEGTHQYHESGVTEGDSTLDFLVDDHESSFDWMWFVEQPCDYQLKFKYSVEC